VPLFVCMASLCWWVSLKRDADGYEISINMNMYHQTYAVCGQKGGV